MKTSKRIGQYLLLFFLIAASTVMIAGCSQSIADSRAPGNPDFQRGKAYYNKQEYATAAQYFERAVKTNPNGWLFRNWLGGSYFRLKEYDKAVENLEISNRGRETADNHFTIGASYYYLGDYDAAIRHLERFLEMGRDADVVHYYLGESYLAKGQYDKAIGEFYHADQIKRNRLNDAGIAKAYMGKKEYENAAPYLKKWAGADAYNPTVHQLLGEAYLHLAIYDEAAKEFQRSNLIKETGENYEGLGDIYCKLERYDDAFDAYAKSMEFSDDSTLSERVKEKTRRCKAQM